LPSLNYLLHFPERFLNFTSLTATWYQQGVDDAIASVKALSGLAIVCLTVALVPLGAMLTLRFLNMVLSRV
jgi:hypothetical protein